MALGIFTFEQISQWDDDAVISFARALGMSPGKLFQEDWDRTGKIPDQHG
jgi:predicted flap endonuclease-1-like 5' DNA nuclease